MNVVAVVARQLVEDDAFVFEARMTGDLLFMAMSAGIGLPRSVRNRIFGRV